MADTVPPTPPTPPTPPSSAVPSAPTAPSAPYAPGAPPAPYAPGAAGDPVVYGAPTTPALPDGVELASVGRRVGAYFLAIPLAILTLWIGYVVWGLIVWGKGTSPALQVLGMRAWRSAEGRPAGWGTMALRDVVGGILQAILGAVTLLVSFVMFLADEQHRTIADRIGGTVIVHDPRHVIG